MKGFSIIGALICGLGVVAISPTSSAQALNPPARDILKSDRPLLGAEIAVVLEAARRAISGKALRLSYTSTGPGPELLMGENGRPRFTRMMSGGSVSWTVSGNLNGVTSTTNSQPGERVDLITFIDYTGTPARSCSGAALDGEFVVEYEHRSTDDRWTAKARTRTAMEFAAPLFDMLAGVTASESGGRRQIGDRAVRGLVAPWKLPPSALTNDPPQDLVQTLWLDTESLLPLRFSIAVPANPASGTPAIPDYGLSFIYDSTLKLTPPEIASIPDCVR